MDINFKSLANLGKKKKKKQRHDTRVVDRRHWAERIGLKTAAVKSRLFKKLYPFEPVHVEVHGHNMHYVDEGDGEPVVMVHGNPTWSFFYRNLIMGLSDKYRCLAVDHLGCGFSDKPGNFTYDLDHHIDNFERWVDIALPPADWNGGKFNLIVHDWGGPIGLGYAVRYPDRIHRVVVMNSSVFTTGTMPKRITICRTPLLGDFLVRGMNLFADCATRMTTVHKMPAEVKKDYLLPYNSWKNRIAVLRFVQDIPLRKGTPTYKRLDEIEGKIKEAMENKPMLIQWGMKDWCFTPKFLEKWKKNFPDAQVDEHEAGHYLLEDAGEEILANIRKFLDRPLYRPTGSMHDEKFDSLDSPEELEQSSNVADELPEDVITEVEAE